MKASELRPLSAEELESKVRELAEDLFHLRFQAATGQLRNSAKTKQVRRDLARVRTVLNERRRSA